MELFDYQKTGSKFLADRSRAALWDDPGLGKTIQILDAANQVGVTDAIVTCPASVRMVWQQECEKMNIDSHIVMKPSEIGSGFNIISSVGAVKMQDELKQHKAQLLINDEHHEFKNIKAQRTEAVFGKDGLCTSVDLHWAASATPMPNHPGELYPLFRAMRPQALRNKSGKLMSYWQFVHYYCKTNNATFGLQILGARNTEALKEKIKGFALRRKKSAVLKDLPEMRYETLPLMARFKDISEEDEAIQQALNSEDPIAALNKIQTSVSSIRRVIGEAKADAIVDWVKDYPEDKIVLFAHHKSVIDKLRKIPHSVVIDGSTPAAKRSQIVNEFQNGDARVFIGQLQAAGTGLTLTAASTLVFVEYSWVPADNIQAGDRIHRIGQKESCLCYFATVPGSIDEKITRVVKQKTKIYKELGL